MSSAPDTNYIPSNFEALFDAALAKYAKQTGTDLRNHPLAYMIDSCNSPDSVLAIFEEQAKAFDEFRNGDSKLVKWLRPVVNGLHAISSSAALTAGVDLVSSPEFYISKFIIGVIKRLPLVVSPCKTHFFWNRHPSRRTCHPRRLLPADTNGVLVC
jgi:hypothetical protein